MNSQKINCIIVHGCPSDSSEEKTKEYAGHWMPWIKKELTVRGIETNIPFMPRPWLPDYTAFKRVFEKYPVTANTILIGHSCGSAFLVRWLGETKREIYKLLLVAPWKETKYSDIYRKRFYGYTVNEDVKLHVKEIVMFTADNEDAIGKNALKTFHSSLGGKIIQCKGMGHYCLEDMRSEAFPDLLKEVMRGI